MSLRVLHVITGLGPGGAETVLFRLAMRHSNFEHEIICLAARDEWYTPALEENGVAVHHLDFTSISSGISGSFRLQRLIRSTKPNIVQCWMYRSNVLAGVFGRFARIPVIWNIRCSSPALLGFRSRLWAYAGGFLARWVPSCTIICSNRAAECHATLGYSTVEQRIIHNGYEPRAFVPDDNERLITRSSLGIADDCLLLGVIARWNAYKNIPLLLSAARKAHDNGIKLKCLLVGHLLDRENAELMSAIAKAGCSNLVIPMGRRSDVQSIARALDLHVLTSRSEGFPNVVAETMLCGTPNVVTDVGDAALLVGDTGWVVSPDDLQGIVSSIEVARRERANEPDQWQKRRSAARRRIVNKFSLEKMASAYEEVWRRYARPRTA